MQQSYGMGYAEYCRKLENRMKVERMREKDHQQSLKVLTSIQSKMHSL